MELGIDRPRAPKLTIESGKGAGKTIYADYLWGDASEDLPRKVRVFVFVGGDQKWIDEIDGPFSSLADADQQALLSASNWYDRGNG